MARTAIEVEYPSHDHKYFERRDAALLHHDEQGNVPPLNEELCVMLIRDQRAIESVQRHILVMAIRQSEADGNITTQQAEFMREHMDGDTYQEIAQVHGCHRNTVINQVAKACQIIKAALPNDEARLMFEMLLEVFGARVLSLAGYCREE